MVMDGPCPAWCPTRPGAVIGSDNQRVAMGCDSFGCAVCGPRKARRRAAAVTWAAREAERVRLVTLTKLPCRGEVLDWQAARSQVRDLTRNLHEAGYSTEWAWCVERNPRGTGFHVHAAQHGDYLPQRLLSEMWGGRRVDIRGMQKPDATAYVVKEASRLAGYVVKGADGLGGEFGGLAAHLAVNGGRVFHNSRGFFHGATLREALGEVGLARSGEVEWRHVPGACACGSCLLY